MAASREPQDPRPQDQEHEDTSATEQTPLLPREQGEATDQSQPQREQSAQAALESLQSSSKPAKRRWPSILALVFLCITVILIIVFVFIAPSAVEQYAQEALVFEPSSLSIDSFTKTGVRARVQGDFMMDGSRVKNKAVRDLGRFCTYIAGAAESGDSDVEVSLPEYGNVVLGTAHVPGIKVNIRDGRRTHLDVLSDLEPGEKDGIRQIANDWIDGRLGQLRVLGKASVPIKSGIFSLGSQSVQHEILFSNNDIPNIPSYDITRLLFHDVKDGMAADVSLIVQNDYPVDFTVPPMSFSILVDNCKKSDPYIRFAEATTQEIHIVPRGQVVVNVTGLVHELPDILLTSCPGTNKSPLDNFLGNYMHGKENTIYVEGSDTPSPDTPDWITELIEDLTVPVPLPGRTLGKLVKNFTLADTHFSLPEPWAAPNTPEAQPRISAKVKALVALPQEMNFDVSVSGVKADADIFYKGKKFGHLVLDKWQQADSHRTNSADDGQPELLIESQIEKAPVYITDEDVLDDVIQEIVFRGKSVMMDIKANVDVQVQTGLGELAIRQIPASGKVPVKPVSPPSHHKPGSPKDFISLLKPKVGDLKILETRPTGLTLSALVNLTNPTLYSATIPYLDINIIKNGSLLGHATVKNMHIVPGNNTNLNLTANYDPLPLGGKHARKIGAELISQYLSGFNATLTLQTHNGTLPSAPHLGSALSKFPLKIPIPHLPPSKTPPPSDPSDPSPPPDDDKPHFIRDATLHLLTSTATFTLFSPLHYTPLYITTLNATALYTNSTGQQSAVGNIFYDEEFEVLPVGEDGEGSETPRLPVEFYLGSVGFEAVRRAVGGRLKIGARAEVGIRVGKWREGIWFLGKGIGAKVRL